MVCKNYTDLKTEIGDVTLLVVSKTQSVDKIKELYDCGVRAFGENRIEELSKKVVELPADICWHFIGRIQTKKIRNIVKCADLIHSVDSFKAIETINKEAGKISKVQDVLIQLNVSEEESKTGFDENSLVQIMEFVSNQPNVNVVGLMTMAPFTDDHEVLSNVFTKMKSLYDQYDFSILSMGMSNDYHIAIECGSNLVRVGTRIFSE